jgi:ADP-ribose pyrophosphatase YjhB (NUDIX family)
MKTYQYCPACSQQLSRVVDGRPACECGFVHYNNPVPVVAVMIPREEGLVLVQRGVPPFKGEWCMPCGYINEHEIPKVAAVREAREETGLDVRLEQILCVCNPMPGEINQLTITYLARAVGGELRAGDDALAVDVFPRDRLPKVCFRSHRMLIDKWVAGRLGRLTGTDLD